MGQTSEPKGTRTFIAVALPPAVRTALFTACAALGNALPGVRWARKVENFHATLRFLGNVSDRVIQDLGDELTRQLARRSRFAVGVAGLGAFPTARRANVIWAGVDDPTGELARVVGVVASTTAELGLLPGEARAFHPHVTLGRSKGGVDARAALAGMPDPVFGTFTVDALHIYESRLGPGGSTYILRSLAPLG